MRVGVRPPIGGDSARHGIAFGAEACGCYTHTEIGGFRQFFLTVRTPCGPPRTPKFSDRAETVPVQPVRTKRSGRIFPLDGFIHPSERPR